ncbi:MAG: trypsin-like peptidase domain-containing protein [Elusimicrobiales bacterium]|nr:trypsin-like peptidase domain-containing protein [Elusimicrobiales bacterium]
MKKTLNIVVAAAVFTLAAMPSFGAESVAKSLQGEFRAVIAQSKPAVVNIRITQQFRVMSPYDIYEYMFGVPQAGRVYRVQGNGSGVIIDPAGYIVTNAHVVSDVDNITVTLTRGDGTEVSYPGKVTGVDSYLDIAVVKVEAKEALPFLKFGDSSKSQPGDWTIAIGSPFGLAQTATVGVLSAVRQRLELDGRKYNNVLQTDAAINMGNSGGPLLNIDGEVVGINTAIYSPSGGSAGVGFAIPASEVLRVLDSLKKGAKARPGWMGVTMSRLDDATINAWGLKGVRGGAVIASVAAGSPAEKASLRRGDIITSCDGADMDPGALAEMVSRRKAGSEMECDILRKGRTLHLKITLGENPSAAAAKVSSQEEPASETPPASSKEWEGMFVRDTENGVEVAGFRQNSRLREYLQKGDIINGIDRSEVSNSGEFAAAAQSASLRDGVVFDIVRQGAPMYISLKL